MKMAPNIFKLDDIFNHNGRKSNVSHINQQLENVDSVNKLQLDDIFGYVHRRKGRVSNIYHNVTCSYIMISSVSENDNKNFTDKNITQLKSDQFS